MPDLEDQLRRYGDAVDRAAAGPPAVELETARGRRRRWLPVGIATVAAALIAVAVVVVVRGDDASNDDLRTAERPGDVSVTGIDVANRTFAVIALTHNGVFEPVPVRPIVLAFGETTVDLLHGCEDLVANYVVREGRIDFDFGFRDFFAGCLPSTGKIHGAVQVMLMGSDRMAATDAGVLTLSNPDPFSGQTVAVYAVDVTDQAAVDDAVAADATTAVGELLQHVARGEWDAARQIWQGYPFDPEDAQRELEALVDAHPWLIRPGPDPQQTFGATPSAGFSPLPVVTVVSEPDGAGERRAAAFVVSAVASSQVGRIPSTDDTGLGLPQGATVAPGQRIVVDGVPVEGGAVAHVNGVEVPVDVDHDALTTSFTIPAWVRGEAIVTLSMATPELPTAYAAWYRVG